VQSGRDKVEQVGTILDRVLAEIKEKAEGQEACPDCLDFHTAEDCPRRGR
jgi:hypothetical protein